MKNNYDFFSGGGWRLGGGEEGAKRPRSVPNVRKCSCAKRAIFFRPEKQKSGRTIKLRL